MQTSPATAASTLHAVPTLQEATARIQAVEAHQNQQFFERQAVNTALLTGMIAGEHVALIGPPGIAKSAVINELAAIIGATHFEYLLTRFTEPNEVFGPVDIGRFKSEGKYVRNTVNMLPRAQTAFLDEAFKANSAILNALLTLLNERRFDNGGVREHAPLRTALLASNELPQEANLAALWDRCLLRLQVAPIADEANWVSLCFDSKPPVARPPCSIADFEVLGAHAATLKFSGKTVEACRAIKNKMTEKGVHVSDRRWKKAAQSILRSYAALKGAMVEVTEEHVDVLRYVLWEKPDQIPVIDGIVEEFAAAWIAATRELSGKLDEAAGRLASARAMQGGARLRALADLTDLIEPLCSESMALNKAFNRKETLELVKRAESLTTESVNAARGR